MSNKKIKYGESPDSIDWNSYTGFSREGNITPKRDRVLSEVEIENLQRPVGIIDL